MLKLPITSLTVFISVLVLQLLLPTLVFAQTLDVANTYLIQDDKAVSGDIMRVTADKGLVRSNTIYDPTLFGVLQDNPLIVYREVQEAPNQKAISRNGDVVVNVTNYNGTIRAGDYISSSPIAGKGMKASQSGYVIGVATSAFAPDGQTVTFQGRSMQSGQVKVALQIQYADISNPRFFERLLSAINAALFRNFTDPEKSFLIIRYIIAAVVASLFFLIGFFGFTRSIAKGVEAIGRNPLAKQSIQFSVFLHLALTIVITLIGLVLAIVILKA
jgi:F0F1-type ATP synthase membrane subunit c/vacuolar-type H+-ATPase subunit K